MDERAYHIRVELTRRILNVNVRIHRSRHQLASAVAEQERLRRHLDENLKREEERA